MRWVNGDQISKVARLSSSKNFNVRERILYSIRWLILSQCTDLRIKITVSITELYVITYKLRVWYKTSCNELSLSNEIIYSDVHILASLGYRGQNVHKYLVTYLLQLDIIYLLNTQLIQYRHITQYT